MPFPILTYHHIRPMRGEDDPLGALSVAPDEFRKQMALLQRLGYRGVSVGELIACLSSGPKEKIFAISFDDGFQNVADHALPVLSEFGFSATCYFVAGELGGVNGWDALAPSARCALMDHNALLAWQRAGHEVGSHTLNHTHLPRLSARAARAQIERSRAVLEDLTGTPVSSFCYPYGELNPRVRELVIEAGYSSATTTVRGAMTRDSDRFRLPRLSVRGGRGQLAFLGKFMSHALLPMGASSARSDAG